MIEKFRKFFTSEVVFLAAVVVAALCFLVSAVTTFLSGSVFAFVYFNTVMDTGLAAAVVFLYVSYRSHEKNVMKGLLGLVLGVVFAMDAFYLAEAFGQNVFGVIFYLLTLLVDGALTVNHFIINSDHHSSPKQVFLNQILVLTRMGLLLIDMIPTLVENAGETGAGLLAVATVSSVLAFAAALGTVVCVESRLDAYRIERDVWNEALGIEQE